MGITADFNGTIQPKDIKIKINTILADWLCCTKAGNM